MDFMDLMDLDIVREVEEVRDIGNGAFANIRIYRAREDPFEKYDDKKFRSRYRFTKDEVVEILRLLDHRLDDPDGRGGGLTPEQQLLCALRYFARGQIQDDTGDLHGVSQPTISRVVRNVAVALADLRNQFIFMPRNREEETRIMTGFYEFGGCPRIIGAIDGTHIPICNPGGPFAQMYINRKGWYSLNVQAVVSFNAAFQDVVARWRGSAHDSRIFNESVLKRRFENGEFRGKLVGDSGYAASHFMLTPFLNPVNQREESYNDAHILTRGIVERSFGRLKQKFRILLKGVNTKLDTTKAIIMACMVLHNLAVEWHGLEDDERDDHDSDDDSDDDSDQQGNNNQFPQPNEPVAEVNLDGKAFRNRYVNRYF